MVRRFGVIAVVMLATAACAGVQPSDQPGSTIAVAGSCGPTTATTLLR